MVKFQYDVDQQLVEIKASNWCGLEQIFLDGKCVSRKINFSQHSEHSIQLKNGDLTNFRLFLDPTTKALVCHIYDKNQLIISLTQAQYEVIRCRRFIQEFILVSALLCAFLLYIN
ncbi:hypothetical protein [Shewanella surugensis]|uniref:Transmembrane protein n=1 Tax=Shewanella surugensis TaxID=212020 RepID=A0ABT0LGK1_9GAMM|nr:hypothetical protein [Shewanella surugensis]MCL1126794.1 hypothetical protein [Shewanella surugensis]